MKLFLTAIITLFSIEFSNAQEQLSNLKIQELAAPDSMVSMILVEFSATDLEKLSKLEIIFDNAPDIDGNKQVLDIIHEQRKQFVILLNKEHIEVNSQRIGFVTLIPKPSKIPYRIISIRGIEANGQYTNVLIKERLQ